MSYRRDQRSSRASLLDDIEEGGLRGSSRDNDERDNDKAIDSLQDRVSFLKRYYKVCMMDRNENGVFNILASSFDTHKILEISMARIGEVEKELTGDIHEEVESHNRMLSRMGNDMDASRGIMSGTMARFKSVFENRSNRRMCKLVAFFVMSFLGICYFIRTSIPAWKLTFVVHY